MTSSSIATAVNAQKDIHDVTLRLDEEAQAFAEVRNVLAKHGLLEKYGLTLLHKHFDLAEDEILLEETNLENRTLTTKPAKIGAIDPQNLVEVTWALGTGATLLACRMVCYKNSTYGQHYTWEHRTDIS